MITDLLGLVFFILSRLEIRKMKILQLLDWPTMFQVIHAHVSGRLSYFIFILMLSVTLPSELNLTLPLGTRVPKSTLSHIMQKFYRIQ